MRSRVRPSPGPRAAGRTDTSPPPDCPFDWSGGVWFDQRPIKSAPLVSPSSHSDKRSKLVDITYDDFNTCNGEKVEDVQAACLEGVKCNADTFQPDD